MIATAFVDAAREAEEIIRAHPDVDDADLAEGFLYLAGMWKFHLERAFAGSDPDRPRFVRDMDGFTSWGLPTPDSHYLSADIDGAGEYRIIGERGTCVDYCFEVLSGLVGDDGVIGDRIDAVEAKDIRLQPDGRFVLRVGGRRREHNWLTAGPTARTIFVRQTVGDWHTEGPTPLLIERLDAPRSDATRPTVAEVAALYRKAGTRMLDQVRFLDGFARQWTKALPENEIPPPRVGPADAGYFPGQYNSACRFALEAGQGLLVTMPASTAHYQSLALGHPLWFNSLNPRCVQSSLNTRQAQISEDGLYRFVIAPQDPGMVNWLDTAGKLRGFLFVRYQQAATAPPAPHTDIVSVANLPAEIAATERISIAEARRLTMDRRFA